MMRPMASYILFLTVFLLNTCKNKPDSVIESIQTPKHLTYQKPDTIGYPLGENPSFLGWTHIIDRAGAQMKQDTSNSAETLGRLEYGTRVKICEFTPNWLGIIAEIEREETQYSGSNYKVRRNEKVYILKKSTGTLKEILLIPSELNKVVSMTKLREKTISYNPAQPLQEFLHFELAYKAEYLSNKANKVEQLIKDSTGVKVKGKQLILQFASKQRAYVSENENDEDGVEYEYVGQIPAINKYVIRAIYWEDWEHILIDRTSGEESIRPHEFPHLSPDGKYIIVFEDDVFKDYPEVELYSINGNTIEPIVNLAFANWSLPEAPESSGFWGKDGYFYIPVIHRNYFDFYGNEIKDKVQYMRIRIL